MHWISLASSVEEMISECKNMCTLNNYENEFDKQKKWLQQCDYYKYNPVNDAYEPNEDKYVSRFLPQ